MTKRTPYDLLEQASIQFVEDGLTHEAIEYGHYFVFDGKRITLDVRLIDRDNEAFNKLNESLKKCFGE